MGEKSSSTGSPRLGEHCRATSRKTIRSSAESLLDVITKEGSISLDRSHDERFCLDRIFECLDVYEATGTGTRFAGRARS